jgi:endonuclease-3
MDRQQRADKVVEALAQLYPDAATELEYSTGWQLLVATILSAQCTDERINQVTPALFERWPEPEAMAEADDRELEEAIRSTGFYRNKARALKGAARAVVAEHGGELPRTVEAMVALPGVGRKTANVVLGEAFGIAAGIAVDTHVKRVTKRIGLTEASDPDRVEADLEAVVPTDEWTAFSMRTILHGRRVCRARSPRCDDCDLEPLCAKVGV